MRSQLADHFRRIRIQSGLRLRQLSRLVGYKNAQKGSNRIQRFEQRGEIHADLLGKLADVLCIDSETVDALIEQDRREFALAWNRWADQPIQPSLVIRWLSAVYARRELPGEIESLQEAEAYSAATARRLRKKVCLKWSRRCSVWFDETGVVTVKTEARAGVSSGPSMWLSGSHRRFVLEHPETGKVFLRLTGDLKIPGNGIEQSE
jgi:hypothetical protein